jgi:transposase
MIGKSGYQSWTISDELWEAVRPYIPVHLRDETHQYQRKPGGGRKPPDKRRILEAILYVLRTGCQWKSIPKGSNVHRYFQIWAAAGFFESIWTAGLYEYDELKGLDWEWLSLDGCMTKAPLAKESVGPNPTDRGKNGDKTQRARRRPLTPVSGCDSRG